MIDFLYAHWKAIVLLIVALIEVIASFVVIIKLPKNKVLTAFKEIVIRLPEFVNEAESLMVGANRKKMFVIKRCFSVLASFTGFSDEKIEKLYFDDISKLIEDILSTPQKKGY